MRESYPPADDLSSPALPELADPPKAPFQFGMKQLLALMLAIAFLATGVHYASLYIMRLNQRVPAYGQSILLPEVILFSVLLGVWTYLVIRTVFLARHAVQLGRRWRAAQRCRREMKAWLVARREALSQDASQELPARVD